MIVIKPLAVVVGFAIAAAIGTGASVAVLKHVDNPALKYAGRHCNTPQSLDTMIEIGARYKGDRNRDDRVSGDYLDLYPVCTNDGANASKVEIAGYKYVGTEKHTIYKFTATDSIDSKPHIAFTDQISETEL